MIRKYLSLLAVTASSLTGYAQKSYNEQVHDYIEKFKDLAVAEQLRTGVPASIKLAQGIYETGAGSSELCNNASNHFGIKCKTSWTGDTYTYTDDAKDECFRKYESAINSYKDHSDFLKSNKRYSSLFVLSPTDYAGWAYGLKRCGYATNPAYAKKIIKTIEDFQLQEYTYAALGNNTGKEVLYASAAPQALPRASRSTAVASRNNAGENVPGEDGYYKETNNDSPGSSEEIIVSKLHKQEKEAGNSSVSNYYQMTSKNGKKGFFARKGDMLLEHAIKNKVRYAKLLELNDLPDAPLEADMFIYLERKARIGSNATHKVESGETLLQISQQEGLQLQQLRAYNRLAKNEEPVTGSLLSLQTNAIEKPEVYQIADNTEPANTITNNAKNSNEGYIATKKTSYSTPEHIVNKAEEPAEEISNTGSVNIANEKPVEETIAEERSQKKTVDESKLSALDKLKAHMDKTVYASNNEFEPKSSRNYEPAENNTYAEETVTVPAKKVVTTATVTPREKKAAEQKKAEQKKKEVVNARNKSKNHTVRKGESLYSIAEKYDLTVSQLQKINKLGGAKKITPGMKLKVTK